MSDNALEKLFDEMRETERAFDECTAESNRLNEARKANNDTLNELGDRRKLLERTLKKHIHEGVPIVQAKMMAHEDQPATDTTYNLAVQTQLLMSSIASQQRWISSSSAKLNDL